MDKFGYKEKVSSTKMNKMVDEVNENTKGVKTLNENFEGTYKTLYDPQVGDIPTLHKNVEGVKEKVDELQLFKYPNATIIGNLTINNGSVSGFSKDNYLHFPSAFNFNNEAFSIELDFTTNADITTHQCLIGSIGSIELFINSGQLGLKISADGETWKPTQWGSTNTIIPNTHYQVKVTWDKTQYKVFYKMYGVGEYIETISYELNQQPFAHTWNIGISNINTQTGNPFKGTINLHNWIVKENNDVVWQGMDDAGLTTRLATDLSNIDEEGVDKVKEIVTPELEEKVGDLSTLQTQEKSNLVGAINEIKQCGGGGSSDIDRNLGKYTTNEQYASLSIAQNGKAISTEGVIINKSGYAISNEIPVTKGHLYLFKSSINVSDVSLFANKIVGNIVYIDTHETITLEDSTQVTRITTRATTKGEDLQSHTYTYVYNADNLTDTPNDIKEGNVSKGASFVFPTQYTEYEPMFSANGAVARPIDGYYVLTASVTGNLVISANESDIKGYLIECIYGALKSIINNLARKADVDVVSTLYKRGVVSQTHAWNNNTNVIWGVIPQANIDLFVSAGALFNDGNEPIERDAPWGETVQHLPGYFYLNGLGDISYNEMEKIYNETNHSKWTRDYDHLWQQGSARTNIPMIPHSHSQGKYDMNVVGYYSNIEVFNSQNNTLVNNLSSVNSMWFNSSHLKYFMPIISLTYINNNMVGWGRIFINCKSLVYVRIQYLHTDCILDSQALLSNNSILYMIQNASNTTTITITLHPAAYARAMADEEILVALRTYPLITLASA